MVKQAQKDVKKKEVGKSKTKSSKLKPIWQELKKVKWPSFKEMLKYTWATFLFCLFFALFFVLLDVLFAALKGWLS